MNNGPVPSPMRETARDFDEPPREPPRPEMREPLRIVDDGRERARRGLAALDPYNIDDILAIYCPTRGNDPTKVDQEISFEWKRYEVAGKPDYAEQRSYLDQGWRFVEHQIFPGRFAPPGTTGPVIVKDMVLMERPMRLTVQARNEEIAEATRAMLVHRRTLGQTPPGQAQRTVFADRSSRESIEIPE